MNDEPAQSGRHPKYRAFEQDGYERIAFSPHRVWVNGRLRQVYPAGAMYLTYFGKQDGDQHPAVRIDAHGYCTSLLYAMSSAELRSLGTAMLEMAAEIDEVAAQQAADLIARAAKKGG